MMSHGVYQFGNAISGIFVTLYLWTLTEDLWVNGAFQLITLLSAPIATIYMGKIAKVRDRLFAYRSGIYLTAVYYLLILLVQERMVDYYMLFALLKGVSTAFYWVGNFTMIYDVSTYAGRHKYLGWNAIVTHAANLTGPALAGVIITLFKPAIGYNLVFGLALAMFILSAVVSLGIRKQPSHHTTYYLKYTCLLLRRRTVFARSLIGWFVIGMPQGILLYVPAILLYHVLQQEAVVGYLNAFFLSLSILSSYVLSRVGNHGSTRFYLSISAWGCFLATMVLLLEVSVWTVVLFMCASSLFKPIQVNAYTAHYYQMIGGMPLGKHFRIESIVIREAVINLGRAGGVLLFMLTAGEIDNLWLPWVVVIVMLLQLGIAPLLGKDESENGRSVGYGKSG